MVKKLWTDSTERVAKEEPREISGVELEVAEILGPDELERSIVEIEDDDDNKSSAEK